MPKLQQIRNRNVTSLWIVLRFRARDVGRPSWRDLSLMAMIYCQSRCEDAINCSWVLRVIRVIKSTPLSAPYRKEVCSYFTVWKLKIFGVWCPWLRFDFVSSAIVYCDFGVNPIMIPRSDVTILCKFESGPAVISPSIQGNPHVIFLLLEFHGDCCWRCRSR